MTTKITPETIKLAGELLRREHTERLKLEKEASATVLEKRAQKIAFREIELGLSEPFKSLEEFQEKVASLLSEGDLDVVEKALDRGYVGTRKSGDLVGSSTKAKNPLDRYILTGELDNE
jgi:hypothetical protein